ncbi:MAG: RNA methyltransferase [Culturomica sp.]|jgi:TrmH family RNA methyltransferase|nr:RNA methyltransferase [Culturomica sp.]
MITKPITKLIQNLEKKKFREKYNLFKIEGDKLVKELMISKLKINHIYGYTEWLDANHDLLGNFKYTEISEKEMKAVSNFTSTPEVIALAYIPEYQPDFDEIYSTLSIVLNGIQDPGNLGTILRVADWFGVNNVFCDRNCASFHNPKCVQASMGAIFRIKVFYEDLTELLSKTTADDFLSYGTFLDGENIYKTSLSSKGFIVMGNEGNGIQPEIAAILNKRLTIPSFAVSDFSSESLNVGVATGIILSEFKRNTGAIH